MKKKIVYFSHSNSNPQEGGMARNHAFFQEMQKRDAKIYNYTSLSFLMRFLSILKNIMLLLIFRDKTIVVLQTVLLKFIFPLPLFKYGWYRNIVHLVLSRASRHNTVYIEINDLILEQAKDLNIRMEPAAVFYQKFIFSMKDFQFIFAAQEMGDYVMEKYGIELHQYQAVINGAPLLDISLCNDLNIGNPQSVKYIYAGTLNRGREIEKCIEIFSKNEGVELVLIGTEGEWIKELSHKNIHYLGQFDEEMALSIASKCDIGIIPYNEDKFYYHICYPTKNSFYIAAGLPILCTPLRETMRVFKNFPQTIFFLPIDCWSKFLAEISPYNISRAKVEVNRIKNNFSWEKLLSKMKLN